MQPRRYEHDPCFTPDTYVKVTDLETGEERYEQVIYEPPLLQGEQKELADGLIQLYCEEKEKAEAKAERIEGIESKLDELLTKPKRSSRRTTVLDDEVINLTDFAAEIGVDIRTLKHHVTTGELPATAIKTRNGRTQFRVEREKAREWWASRNPDSIRDEIAARKQRLRELRERAGRTASAAQRASRRS